MDIYSLSDDIIELVVDRVFRLRKKLCTEELLWSWKKSRLRLKLFSMHHVGSKNIHGARVLFTKTDQAALNLRKINKDIKYYTCGMRIFIMGDYNYVTGARRYGMSLRLGNKHVTAEISDIVLKNGWKDLRGQTDINLVRYLMDKDEEMQYYPGSNPGTTVGDTYPSPCCQGWM